MSKHKSKPTKRKPTPRKKKSVLPKNEDQIEAEIGEAGSKPPFSRWRTSIANHVRKIWRRAS